MRTSPAPSEVASPVGAGEAASPAAAPPAGATVLPLFAAAIFVGAFLLFAVEPLIGRFVLPWFGGSPAVWTTCMLFFQVMLLAGYAYAMCSVRYLPPRAQPVVHGVLLLAALAFLPIIPSPGWKPSPRQDPTLRVILLLTCTIGLPFFVLAATAPLLQAWLARLAGRSPYRLFALSNLASLSALVLYPLAAEPLLTRRAQAIAWSAGLAAFVVACGVVAAVVWRAAPAPGRTRERGGRPGPGALPAPRVIDRVLWFVLPCCASGLLLAVTNTLCQDVAAVPLLWVLPLALYLLSFVIAFDSPRWYRRRATAAVLIGSLALLCAINLLNRVGLIVQVSVYATCLLAACLACHGELARLKPEPRLLGPYYLSLSAGGALGGVSVALVAPLLFTTFLELHLFLMACMLLLVCFIWRDRRFVRDLWISSGPFVALLLLLTAVSGPANARVVARSRNFYGSLKVQRGTDEAGAQVMRFVHGRILHGVQYTDPARRREPTAYFRPTSGVGVLLRNFAAGGRPRRLGVVGLGAGTLAAYGRPGDSLRFYEINPDVARVARTWFTFLADCPSTVDVVLGDGRLSLEREDPQHFDVLVLDAFSGDSIPTHLLTTEAFGIYLRHLNADGVLAVQVTNRSLDLAPLVTGLGHRFQLHGVEFRDDYSSWVLLTKNAAFLSLREVRENARPLVPEEKTTVWTDDYCNLLRVLRR